MRIHDGTAGTRHPQLSMSGARSYRTPPIPTDLSCEVVVCVCLLCVCLLLQDLVQSCLHGGGGGLLLQYLIQSCSRGGAMRYDEPRLVWTRLTTTLCVFITVVPNYCCSIMKSKALCVSVGTEYTRCDQRWLQANILRPSLLSWMTDQCWSFYWGV
jgi:hypothetical protein